MQLINEKSTKIMPAPNTPASLPTDYNLQEICFLLNKSRKIVGTWIKDHRAPHTIMGREIRINLAELFDWRVERERAIAKPQESDVNQAKSRKEIANAEKAELELDIMKENYLPRAIVERVAFERGKHVKDALGAMPDRIVSMLVGETDENRIRKVIEDEIANILEGMSETYIDIDETDLELDDESYE